MRDKNTVMNENEWNYCQQNSDIILAEGIKLLKNSKKYELKSTFPTYCGNYLISLSNEPYYIGQAQNIKKRMKQQSRERTSIFYKNYLKQQKKQETDCKIDILSFDVQIIKTMIGRKEIEEFGIVNLPTKLNKFQLNKRALFEDEIVEGTWNWIQSNYEHLLSQAEKNFFKNESYRWCKAKVKIGPGIYSIEHKKHGLIYIGESSNILDRYTTHSTDTRFSALRRHIATEILGFDLKSKTELGLKTQAKKDKKMYLTQDEDFKVNQYINDCFIRTQIISFGRYELEDYLIKKLKPLLNIKGNK